jgi:ribose transport system ATP-binding protein
LSELALETKDLSISFDKVQILENIDFDLRKGEVHALAGQNGAGKSTLVKILNGVHKPDTGEINIFGEKIKDISPKVALEAGIAMVYQELSLVNTLSVAENIFLSPHPFRKYWLLDDKRAARESEKLLKIVGVGHKIDPLASVEDISVGERQLVEIAKALSHNPRILILDEPTAALAGAETEVLFEAINNLKKQGISIIYITHYLEDIKKICDRVTILRDGQKIKTLETAETSIKKMINLMLGSEEDILVKEWQKAKPNLATKQPLLELKSISTNSVKDISLKIFSGEIVGLAGLLGSGRSEILRAIYGIDSVNSGEIIFTGEDVILKSPREAIAKGISLVPEDRRKQGLVIDFSIENNLVMQVLKLLRRIFLLNKRKSAGLSDEYIKNLKIKSTGRRQTVRFLSGGNQQKVVIGKCFASNSKLLLLDDPTFGVDIHSKIEIMKLIKEYVRQGNSAIFVSSEFKEIAEFCDKTYIVKKFKIENSFDNKELSEEKLLELVQ